MEEFIGGILMGAVVICAIASIYWHVSYGHDIHACMAQHLTVERCNEISQWGVK